MALSQDERIAISKKIVQIPIQNSMADNTIAQINIEKAKAQKEDDGNKKLMDDVTVLVNGYQQELARYDGNSRTELLEQDMLDSSNRVVGNFFFLNQQAVPTPSVVDGVWKNFIPFMGNKAIGKNYSETYGSTAKEITYLNDINAKITAVETFSNITRSTGQFCTAGGTCSLPAYTTQPTCVLNGGVWTPGPDIIASDTGMQTAGTDLINAVAAWETFINGTFSTIVTTDTNGTRAAQNTISQNDITNAKSIIDTWQALANYDTTHGQTTCVGFNSYNVALLDPTKFRAAELLPLKNEITARIAYLITRESELNTNLGTVVQNVADGSITSSSGLYGQRSKIIDMRLNIMGGSLNKLKGFERGVDAQNQSKASNNNAASVYTSIMTCSLFRAPSTGTSTIHIINPTGFSVSDTVYVCAENQEEITTSILSINGNTLTLADKIPPKYRQDELARIYKVL